MYFQTKHSASSLRKSLNLIVLGISFGMAFFTVVGTPLGGAPFTGFIRALGASDLTYSIIMALPVFGGILQVLASYFIESTGKRRPVFLISGFIHRLLWIPIALIPLFVPLENKGFLIWTITALIAISTSANSISSVAFWSWMGALIPSEIMGRFFSRRTMISTITTIIVGLSAGKFLDVYRGFDGFAKVFVTIAILGALDILCFVWVKHPPMAVPEKLPSMGKLFFEPFKNKNYLRHIIFVSVWLFGVNFSAPFFNVYMIERLNMGYLQISLYNQILSSVITIFTIQLWGRAADRYGNRTVSKICCSIAVLMPCLWFFATPSNYTILLVINAIVGLSWQGLDMANLNLSVVLAPEKNRSIYLANYALVTSAVGVALAYVCGGAFMEITGAFIDKFSIPFIFGQKLNNFHLLFAISSLLRFTAVFVFLPKVVEPNSKPASLVFKDAYSSVKTEFLERLRFIIYKLKG